MSSAQIDLNPILPRPHQDWLRLTPMFAPKVWRKRFLTLLFTGITYFLLGVFTYRVLLLNSIQAFPLFPSLGFAVGMVFLFGADALIGGIFGGAAFAIWLGADHFTTLSAVLRGSLQVWLLCYLAQRLKLNPRFHRLWDVVGFFIFALPLPIVLNATWGSLNEVLQRFSNRTLIDAWLTFAVADTVSILMFAPVVMMIGADIHSHGWRSGWQRFQRYWFKSPRAWEGLLWLGLTTMITLHMRGGVQHETIFEYLPFLAIAWSAARFGALPTVIASFLINGQAIVRVLHRTGAFILQAGGDMSVALLMLQTFIAVVMIMGLCLAGVTEERQDLLQQLVQQNRFDQLMIGIAHRVAASLDLQEILDITVQEIANILDVDRVTISQAQPDDSHEVVAESVRDGLPTSLGLIVPTALCQELTQWHYRNGIQIMSDLRQVEHLNPTLRRMPEQYQVQARVGLLIQVDGKIYGFLSIQQCRSPRQWLPQEIAFLEQITLLLGAVLYQTLLYQRERDLAKELEEQVKERTQELQNSLQAQERLNESQNRLIHAVSHDLRTPVVGSLLALKGMSRRMTGNDAAIVECLQNSGERQLNLIQALLEDYRASDGQLQFNFQQTNYAQLVTTTLKRLEPIFAENKAKVVTHLNPDLPLISLDPIHVQRVLENLIINAINHNAPGLTISLRVEEIIMQNKHYLRSTISDNGTGIAEEIAQNLFKRPYLPTENGALRTGTGLGLYFCGQIVTAHGGQITVENLANGGAQFVFTLPL
jgi:signal transduction histidine kinase/integral membrane sensor domain MASE1